MRVEQDYQVVALKSCMAFKFLNFVSKCIAPTRGVYVIMLGSPGQVKDGILAQNPGYIFAPSLVAGMDETAV